jgi:hypothetical protein
MMQIVLRGVELDESTGVGVVRFNLARSPGLVEDGCSGL